MPLTVATPISTRANRLANQRAFPSRRELSKGRSRLGPPALPRLPSRRCGSGRRPGWATFPLLPSFLVEPKRIPHLGYLFVSFFLLLRSPHFFSCLFTSLYCCCCCWWPPHCSGSSTYARRALPSLEDLRSDGQTQERVKVGRGVSCMGNSSRACRHTTNHSASCW